jgi:hypothetical protein
MTRDKLLVLKKDLQADTLNLATDLMKSGIHVTGISPVFLVKSIMNGDSNLAGEDTIEKPKLYFPDNFFQFACSMLSIRKFRIYYVFF